MTQIRLPAPRADNSADCDGHTRCFLSNLTPTTSYIHQGLGIDESVTSPSATLSSRSHHSPHLKFPHASLEHFPHIAPWNIFAIVVAGVNQIFAYRGIDLSSIQHQDFRHFIGWNARPALISTAESPCIVDTDMDVPTKRYMKVCRRFSLSSPHFANHASPSSLAHCLTVYPPPPLPQSASSSQFSHPVPSRPRHNSIPQTAIHLLSPIASLLDGRIRKVWKKLKPLHLTPPVHPAPHYHRRESISMTDTRSTSTPPPLASATTSSIALEHYLRAASVSPHFRLHPIHSPAATRTTKRK
ncbi:hypothetical protein R3P38DRAFT_3188636 [Favolaschia claudopus]|uniref:Uncharacterized protein n=1 Tax=Favolaschia claudopus TaxID=2862362 RepID=A0AAW0BQX9_9AGAR